DDYAHHPTEIAATLRAARQAFAARRIWCVFQPHQLSRTETLFDGFAGAFGDADQVVIGGVYAAREPAVERAAAAGLRLAAAITEDGVPARQLPEMEPIVAHLEASL